MIAAERDFDVIGTVEERVLLPGVRSDDEARGGFVLPVGITAALVLRAFTLEVLPAEALRAEAVTDRPLEVLRLEGRGPLTPDWTFWLDAETGARLAYRLTDSAGQVVATGRYERIRRIEQRAAPRDLSTPRAALGGFELARLLNPATAPTGYTAIAVQRIELGRGVPALRVTYWDGLDALVVLLYERQAKLPAEAEHIASRQVGRFTVSVIGSAPREALANWLESVGDGPLARLDPKGALEGPGSPTGERRGEEVVRDGRGADGPARHRRRSAQGRPGRDGVVHGNR
ncbi:MAG: hypothetical protein M9914_02925 [Trueperaceae bacterium]|nr:hypothetical protein [Trueperaceae bacterium]